MRCDDKNPTHNAPTCTQHVHGFVFVSVCVCLLVCVGVCEEEVTIFQQFIAQIYRLDDFDNYDQIVKFDMQSKLIESCETV